MCDHCGCRAFAPIAELTADHEQILATAWGLAEATRAGRPWAAGHLDGLLDLLDGHIAKEEAGLYPELLELESLSEADRATLEEEHRAVRAALAAGRFDRSDYYALAAHIEVEEMELFSAARFTFDEQEWDEMEVVHRAVDAGVELLAP